MKVSPLLIMILLLLGVANLQLTFADPSEVDPIKRTLISENILLEMLDVEWRDVDQKEKENNLLKAWGIEKRLAENDEFIERNLFYLMNPWPSSERVWRADLITYKIKTLNGKVREICHQRDNSLCHLNIYQMAFVAPCAQFSRNELEANSANFFWVKNQIEETRLVWLADFIHALANTTIGENFSVDEVSLIDWPEAHSERELIKKLQIPSSNYKIQSVSVQLYPYKQAGYVINLCQFEETLLSCHKSEDLLELWVFFKSNNKVAVEARKYIID